MITASVVDETELTVVVSRCHDDSEYKPDSTVNAIPLCGQNEDHSTRVTRRFGVGGEEGTTKITDWRKLINMHD